MATTLGSPRAVVRPRAAPRGSSSDDGAPPGAGPSRLLVVTPWWPRTPDDPTGSFVRDACRSLRGLADVRVAVLRLRKPFERHADLAALDDTGDRSARPRLLEAPWLPHREGFDVLAREWTALLRQAVRQAGPWIRDAVVVVHTQELAVPARRALSGSGIPFVVVAHGLEPDSPRYATPSRLREYRSALASAARVVAVGPSLAGVLRTESPGADVRVALNGYDEALVDLVGKIGDETAGGPPSPRLVSVSNLNEGKGVHLVIRAVASRRRRGLSTPSYDVVGDGPSREAFERLARDEHVADLVRFHGRLDRTQALRTARGAAAFVLPSAPEACGVAYMEAMALGVPPVAVIGEGPSAFVEDGVSGLLVERTESAVGLAVDRLLDDPDFARRVGERAARRARGLGWTSAARGFFDLLPRPSRRPSRRDPRPWLSLFNEPTPYVTAKLDEIEATGRVRLKRAWVAASASQPWGQDASYAPGDVLDRRRRVARTALDLFRGRYAGMHAGGWGGSRTTALLFVAAWLGRRPLLIESDTHVSGSTGTRAHVRRAYLRWLDRRVRTWLPGGTPQAEHLRKILGPRAPLAIEGMATDTRTLLAEAARVGPEAGRRWREEHGITGDARLVLFVGRIAPEKGLADLLAAIETLRSEGRDVHLALLGPGAVETAASTHVPPDRLHALGRVPWRALVPAYLAADVLALPSRFEPWGLVVNEALLLGCPVVVTDAVGASRDLVAGPGAGVVVPAADPRALANGLRTVLDAGGRESEAARRGLASARAWSLERAARVVASAMSAPRREPAGTTPC